MKYGSVCSGIEAATAAWHQIGWEPCFFSEIDKFPRAVLQHHYPAVPLHGDLTTIKEGIYDPIKLLVGGTPCQSFSIAGLRGGMDDDRGNLALEYLKLADRLNPGWIVWENVPGVLSSNGGRDFGSFLGALGELGYGFAYRVLDAQYFGVPQRRRRVFVVGYLGDWRPAAAVLFERESLRWSHPPSRKAKQDAAGSVAKCVRSNSGGIDREDGHTLIPQVAGTLAAGMGKRRGAGQSPEALIPVNTRVFAGNKETEVAATLETTCHDYSRADNFHTVVGPLTAGMGRGPRGTEAIESGHIFPIAQSAVRRLTPVECERLQGFEDNYTAIPWRNKSAEQCPDGPRYKALGNSMAVPCMHWLGQRIEMVDQLLKQMKECA